MASATDQLLIIVNPEAGSKQAVIDIAAEVLPLLTDIPYQLRTTEHPGHAGTIAAEFIQSGDGHAILIAGGDGTTHEIVNTLTFGSSTKGHNSLPLTLVLWPGGTANALFSSLYPSTTPNPDHAHLIPPEADEQTAYRLKSVLAYLHSRSASSPTPSRSLAIAYTSIYDGQGAAVEKIAGVVVASTALHAAILRTADQLRDQIAGVERFKEAARRNLTVWSASDVKLFGVEDEKVAGGIQYYDAEQDAVIPLASSAGTTLEGPFAYFLSTVNVDRLESTFYITSPFTTHPAPVEAKSMEIVIVRPARDPRLASQSLDSEATRGNFAGEMMTKVFPAAYDKGSHVKVRYPGTEGDDNGPTIVEYYRAAGWEWTPRGDDEPSRLVCVDGTVLTIPVGGKVRCQVSQEADGVKPLDAKIFL